MHGHTQDIAWTGEHSVCPDGILKAEALLFLLVRAAHVLAHKLVDLIVRGISQDVVSFVVHEVHFVLLLRERDCLSELPVRFAVQLVRLNEDGAALLSSLEEDEVGRDALPLHNLDDHADFDVLGGNRFDRAITIRLARQGCILSVIELFIASEAVEVVPSFLYHRDDKYEGQWSNVSKQEAYLEEWYKLTDGNDQEEHVEEELELVVEDLEDEGENVVLLIVQTIGYEA